MAATVHAPVSVEALAPRPAAPAELEEGLAAVVQAGGWAFSQSGSRRRATRSSSVCAPGRGVAARAGPRGRRAAAARALGAGDPAAAADRAARRDGVPARLAASLGARAAAAEALDRELDDAGLAAVKVDDAELARFLEAEGLLVRLGDGFVVSAAAYERARELVVAECTAAGEISLARFRDLAGVGRRDAQLLLERLDQDGLTRRLGDRRVLRRAGRKS